MLFVLDTSAALTMQLARPEMRESNYAFAKTGQGVIGDASQITLRIRKLSYIAMSSALVSQRTFSLEPFLDLERPSAAVSQFLKFKPPVLIHPQDTLQNSTKLGQPGI
jgi:hypothetical protein